MRKRTGIQLCYPFEERRLTDPKFHWSWPVIVQPKLDGERCRALCNGKFHPVILLSSTEQKIISVPHISKFLQSLDIHAELDGELYIHGSSFEQIASIVGRSKNISEDHEKMEFHIFDWISKDEQIVRSNILLNMFKERPVTQSSNSPIKMVESNLAYSMQELMVKYHQILDSGYEGIIIRHLLAPYLRKRHNKVLKFKPKKTDIYQIIDILEGSGEHQNMIGAFICQGFDHTQFHVAAGEFSHPKRMDIWKNREDIIGDYLEIAYQNISNKGIPRFAIGKQIISKQDETEEWGGTL